MYRRPASARGRRGCSLIASACRLADAAAIDRSMPAAKGTASDIPGEQIASAKAANIIEAGWRIGSLRWTCAFLRRRTLFSALASKGCAGEWWRTQSQLNLSPLLISLLTGKRTGNSPNFGIYAIRPLIFASKTVRLERNSLSNLAGNNRQLAGKLQGIKIGEQGSDVSVHPSHTCFAAHERDLFSSRFFK